MIRNLTLLFLLALSLSQALGQNAGALFFLDDDGRLATLDPNTGISTPLSPSPVLAGDLLPGAVAVDNEGGRFFFITTGPSQGEELVTADLNTGEAISTVGLNITPTFLEYHCRNGLLYTIDEENNLSSIDPENGQATAIAPVAPQVIDLTTPAVDPYGNRLFFISDEGAGFRLYSVSTENGQVLANPGIGDDISFRNMEYNCRDGQLYGLLGGGSFARMDPQAAMAIPLSGPIAPGGYLIFSQSLSQGRQAYTFSGRDEDDEARLYTVSLADGAVLSQPLLPAGYFLNSFMEYANRCSAEADFGLAVGCAGDTTRFTNTSSSGASFLWNFGDPASGAANTSAEANPIHVYNAPGVYTITLIAADCGADTLSKEVEIPGLSIPPFGDTTLACEDDFPLVLNARTEGATYLWQDGTTDSVYVVEKTDIPANISVEVALGACMAEFSTYVDYAPDADCPCMLAMPNTFTPNGDSQNDFFRPVEKNCRIKAGSYSLRIYNRWGELVFEGADPDAPGWDGNYKNEPAPNEVYFYTLRFIAETDQGDIAQERKGDVTVLR